MNRLLNIIMNDGSRHFGELPQSIDWYRLRNHVRKLKGASVTRFITDGITEAWIDFTFEGHNFSINDQFGSYWFFVDDPDCPDSVLESVLSHCDPVLF